MDIRLHHLSIGYRRGPVVARDINITILGGRLTCLIGDNGIGKSTLLRTLSGFHEGQELTAWSYVVDIPGYFFWDGWPNRMVVSRDPSQNVYTLNYVRLWNSEYTVNYYLMTGADLTADSWSGALAPVSYTHLRAHET